MVPPKQNRPMGVEDYENRWRPGYEGLLVDNYLALLAVLDDVKVPPLLRGKSQKLDGDPVQGR